MDAITKDNFARAIERFLRSNGLSCSAQADGPSTLYWSYSFSEPRLIGWISIFLIEDEFYLSANLNFGVLSTKGSKPTLALLERNFELTNGFHYSTGVKKLVFIGFNVPLRWIALETLANRLEQLHISAIESHARFVNSEFRIDPIPSHWIEMPGDN